MDISAFMLTGSVGYTFKKSGWKPSVWIGYDYLSGTDPVDNDPDYGTFNTLFATNHKYYGYMDYFVNIPAATGGLGLQDIMLKTRFKPTEQFWFGLDGHHFMSAEDDFDGENTLVRR